MMMWVSPDDGMAFVRVSNPTPDEAEWATALAEAIESGFNRYLGTVTLNDDAVAEIHAAALRAFGYAWKYREAPFGEAQWLDEQGGAVRLAGDWLDPIKPILNRYRNVASMIG